MQQEFSEFVEANSRALLRAGWLLTGNWHTSEDLVQSVLLQLWRRWELVRAADSPLAYARRVLMTTYLQRQRRQWRGEISTVTPLERGPNSEPDSSERSARRLDLQRALGQLSPRQRAVVVARYFVDLTEAQTAAALGCSVGTVKSTNAKALQQLRSNPALAELLSEEVG